MKRPVLTIEHVKSVLDKEIVIGSDTSRDGYRVTFTFNPYANEFRVSHDNQGVIAVGCGSDAHELLKTYNEL